MPGKTDFKELINKLRSSLSPHDYSVIREIFNQRMGEGEDYLDVSDVIDSLEYGEDSIKAARIMMDAGILLDATSYIDGLTPLQRSACGGKTQWVKWLIENGALIELVGNRGGRPLYMALTNGNMDAARILLDAGANPNDLSPLNDGRNMGLAHYAARFGALDLLELAINKSMNIGAIGEDEDLEPSQAMTALHYAADTLCTSVSDVKRMIELLIKAGADTRAKAYRRTPAELSAYRSNAVSMQAFFDLGVSPQEMALSYERLQPQARAVYDAKVLSLRLPQKDAPQGKVIQKKV